MTTRFLIGLLLAGMSAVCGNAFGAPGIVRIPNDGYAYDINESGDVVGYDPTNDGNRAYRYTSVGSVFNIGSLSTGRESYAYGINASGVIAGDSRNSQDVQRGFRYNGSWTALDPIGGTSTTYRSWARGINNSGVVVGYSEKNLTESYATLWSGSSATNLGTVAGEDDSFGMDVSNTGYVTGYYLLSGSATSYRAFRKASGGQMLSLGTLPGWGNTFAEAVNDSGVVVGYAMLASSSLQKAFKDVPGVGMVELAPLNGGNTSAYDVNSLGVAVGTSGSEATLWQADGTLVDLNAWLDTVNPTTGAQWDLTEARAINDAGMITGYGRFFNQSGGFTTAPFVLDGSTLVPEPGVAGLFLTTILVGFQRRYRQVH